MNEYQQREYDNKVKLLNELNGMGYQFKLIENKEEPARSEIVLKGLIPVYVNYHDYQKKYSFFLRHNLLYVRYDSENRIKEELAAKGITEPQNVGVLTANKIKAWVEYLIKVYEEIHIIHTQRVAEVTAFLAEVKAQGASISDDKSEFSSGYGCYTGEIVRNGLEFKFKVQDEGYISKEIKVHYSVGNSLGNFLALAENKYTKPQE